MFKMNPMCLFNPGFMPFVIPVSLQTGFYTTLLSGEGTNALTHSAAGKEKEVEVKNPCIWLRLCSDLYSDQVHV